MVRNIETKREQCHWGTQDKNQERERSMSNLRSSKIKMKICDW